MHTDYIARLKKFGFDVTPDEIYTSGQVACEYLLDNFRGKKFIFSATTDFAPSLPITVSKSWTTTRI